MLPILICVSNAFVVWSSGNSLIHNENQTKGQKAFDVVMVSVCSVGFFSGVLVQLMTK